MKFIFGLCLVLALAVLIVHMLTLGFAQLVSFEGSTLAWSILHLGMALQLFLLLSIALVLTDGTGEAEERFLLQTLLWQFVSLSVPAGVTIISGNDTASWFYVYRMWPFWFFNGLSLVWIILVILHENNVPIIRKALAAHRNRTPA